MKPCLFFFFFFIGLGTVRSQWNAIDSISKKRVWVFKTDNSMVNTVNMISSKQIVASTMDGKVSLLEIK